MSTASVYMYLWYVCICIYETILKVTLFFHAKPNLWLNINFKIGGHSVLFITKVWADIRRQSRENMTDGGDRGATFPEGGGGVL